MRLSDIIGHDHVKDVLIRAVAADKVPHAMLFHGPEGVGKRSMALALVSLLVCRNRVNGDACGECLPCRQIADGTYIDLRMVRPEKGIIKIDAVRELLPSLYFEPLAGAWKCLILDDAHAMTQEAANAALKTLEEPPRQTVFCLITSAPDTLPRTVLSRCFGLPFGPLRPDTLSAFLMTRLGLSEAAARSLAMRARGRPGLALRLAESPAMAERGPFVTEFLALADAGPQRRLAFAEGMASSKEEALDLVEILQSVLSDVLLATTGLPDDAMQNVDFADDIRAFAARIGPRKALDLSATLLEWDATHRYNPGLRAMVDRLVLGL